MSGKKSRTRRQVAKEVASNKFFILNIALIASVVVILLNV